MLDYSHFPSGTLWLPGTVCVCVCVCVSPMGATTTSKPQVEPVQAKVSPLSLTMSERTPRDTLSHLIFQVVAFIVS